MAGDPPTGDPYAPPGYYDPSGGQGYAPAYGPGPQYGGQDYGYPPQGYPPQGYPGYPPMGQPPPKKSRKKIAAVVVVAVVAVVALLVLFLVPLGRGSTSGTVYTFSNGQSGQGIGESQFNLSASGSVVISWSTTPSTAMGGIVVIQGACTLLGSCYHDLQTYSNITCSSPAASTGAASGSCTFTTTTTGTYSVVGAILSGYQSGSKIPYTVSVSGPLL
ncbi:MAG: hypothetical protein KGJ23_01590 [Euryarchaeota archaeon]|nr:hypothetical protein [Euryarchaeota archaeon]MDE1835288.1 hypothetical protein [Euryarchaeota archaeon]MDE1881065.1 hypothetical protein [Euryarchaeota archaeon]MDE2043584.1 hypothetical protein [Thermoplasmata archaeon]